MDVRAGAGELLVMYNVPVVLLSGLEWGSDSSRLSGSLITERVALSPPFYNELPVNGALLSVVGWRCCLHSGWMELLQVLSSFWNFMRSMLVSTQSSVLLFTSGLSLSEEGKLTSLFYYYLGFHTLSLWLCECPVLTYSTEHLIPS